MYDGNVATNREDAAKFMGAADEKRLEFIIKGALEYTMIKKTEKVPTIAILNGKEWSADIRFT